MMTKKTKDNTPPEKQPTFPVIGIGASAGGLEALKAFFAKVPANSGMAFVVVVHLTPKKPSLLADILDKETLVPVKSAKDGETVAANHVYVIPPDVELTLFRGKIQLMEALPKTPHLPVDTFLKSLAQDQGNMAAAIILSGTGTDGTLGLREVKAVDGVVLAQDEISAAYDGMPRSAINTGLVDMVLPPQEMYTRLQQYFALTPMTVDLADTPMRTDWLSKIYAILRSRLGYDFSVYKLNTIRRRINRRMGLNQLKNYEQYVRYLRENNDEADALFRELLIGVTSFFRDPESFDILKNKVLPDLFADLDNDATFRVWVAGCSTGEEAYSLAIVLHEFLDSHPKRINLQIFGTDLAGFSIDKARDGLYPESICADVSTERLNRFFTREGNFYRIRKQIRETVIFSVQNVLKDPPFSKLNLLSCRNVLIYFGSDAQKRLLPLFHYTLLPRGILMLGSSETIGSYTNLFKPVNQKWKIFQRQEVPDCMKQQIEFPSGSPTCEQPKPSVPPPGIMTINIVQAAQKAILDQFAPPAILINEDNNIVHIQGRVGKYLEPPNGPPTSNILDQARKGLSIELSSAIRSAKTSGVTVTRKGVSVKTNGDFQLIDLHVCPLSEPEEITGRFLVVFEDIATCPPAGKVSQVVSEVGASRIAELEKELQYTRENHQTTIEELESSNEELKSINEELQSSNEELQSSNEELESSKEELQSLNEEVQTVNAELQSKVEELSQIYDDMRNLLNSTEVATIFVDMDMRIRRFTTEATTIVNLIQSDIGRPLVHVATNLSYADMISDLKEVLQKLTPKECEVQTTSGDWYNMRIIPYRTTDNRIAGAVLTFANIEEQKKTQESLALLASKQEIDWELIRNVFDMNSEPLVVVDGKCMIVIANQAFSDLCRKHQSDIENQPLFSLHNGILKAPELISYLEATRRTDQDFRLEHVALTLSEKMMLFSIKGRIISGSTDKEYRILLSFTQELTEGIDVQA